MGCHRARCKPQRLRLLSLLSGAGFGPTTSSTGIPATEASG